MVMVRTVALVTTADTTFKMTETACEARERTSAQAIARSAAKQAIGPWIAEPTLLQILQLCPPLLHQDQSFQEKRGPSDAFLNSAGPCLIKQ